MTVKPPKEAPTLLLRAADAAVALWKTRKPIGLSVREYANTPTVNWPGRQSARMAKAAAKWWLIQHPAQDKPGDGGK